MMVISQVLLTVGTLWACFLCRFCWLLTVCLLLFRQLDTKHINAELTHAEPD